LSAYTLILFDLDGTLLPVSQEQFVQVYFKQLCKKICSYGYSAEALMQGIWKSTHAMIKNDGSRMNQEVFWDTFSACLGKESLLLHDTLDLFYQNEFQTLKAVTWENPLAVKAVAAAKKLASDVVLATNPIFPRCAVETRLSWIGLAASDFSYVTSYENSHYCKPNSRYYEEILAHFKARPCDCLMIGNDVTEDIEACRAVGIDTYLVTDCLIDTGAGTDLSSVTKGTFPELMQFLNMEKG